MNLNEKKKVWSLRYTPGNGDADEKIAAISDHLGISEVTARLIYNRGYLENDSVEAFLSPLPSGLHDPFLMKDMEDAVKRIFE